MTIEKRLQQLEAQRGQRGGTFEIRMGWDRATYWIDGVRVSRAEYHERAPQDASEYQIKHAGDAPQEENHNVSE